MHTTKTSQVNLAIHQTAPRQDPRIALRRVRVAFAELVTKAPVPGHAWHDVTRTDPRTRLPCEKERAMIHDAIRQGCTTPDRVIRYHVARMQDDLTQFPEAPLLEELLYVQLIREEAEALDAQSIAHALPSAEHQEAAIRATAQVARDARLYCTLG